MDVNQIIAYNIRSYRQDRGLTQEQLAELLEPHLGVRWSKATVSSVERSVDGKRIRKFSVEDLMAIAEAFHWPPMWLLKEPAECTECGRPLAPDGHPQRGNRFHD